MYLNKRKYFSFISIFIILSSLSSCKKYNYYKYSKRWYCEELDFEFYNIVEKDDTFEISEDLLNINDKDYLVNLKINSHYKSTNFLIFSKYGLALDYEMDGKFYIDKNYSTMTINITTDRLFRKYKGHQLIFTSSDIDPNQTFDPSVFSTASWATEDEKIRIGTNYTRNIFGINYNSEEIYPLLFSDNNITVYDKPNGEIILTGTYSGNHKNWSIEIESKSGIFEKYDNNVIKLSPKNTGIHLPFYFFSDDNSQEIIDEFESMYN